MESCLARLSSGVCASEGPLQTPRAIVNQPPIRSAYHSPVSFVNMQRLLLFVVAACDARELQHLFGVAMSLLQCPCPTSVIDLPTVVKHDTTDRRCSGCTGGCLRHECALTSQDQHHIVPACVLHTAQPHRISRDALRAIAKCRLARHLSVNTDIRIVAIYVAPVLVTASDRQVQSRLQLNSATTFPNLVPHHYMFETNIAY